jgi:hypothetical protein
MPSHYSLQVAITQLWLLLHISELPSLIAMHFGVGCIFTFGLTGQHVFMFMCVLFQVEFI